jgi:hypothetical protein
MARIAVGQTVRVNLPKGKSKRGVPGVSVMYATWIESRFEGAVGTVTEMNPRGPFGHPVYLVDFTGHTNKMQLPYQAQWFRGEWLAPVENPAAADERPVDRTGGMSGQAQSSAGVSS